MIKHPEIARDVLEDHKFEIVILVTVDKKGRTQISGANHPKSRNLTLILIRRVIETVSIFLGLTHSRSTSVH